MLTMFMVLLIGGLAALLIGGVKELMPFGLAFAAVTVIVIGMGWIHA